MAHETPEISQETLIEEFEEQRSRIADIEVFHGEPARKVFEADLELAVVGRDHKDAGYFPAEVRVIRKIGSTLLRTTYSQNMVENAKNNAGLSQDEKLVRGMYLGAGIVRALCIQKWPIEEHRVEAIDALIRNEAPLMGQLFDSEIAGDEIFDDIRTKLDDDSSLFELNGLRLSFGIWAAAQPKKDRQKITDGFVQSLLDVTSGKEVFMNQAQGSLRQSKQDASRSYIEKIPEYEIAAAFPMLSSEYSPFLEELS